MEQTDQQELDWASNPDHHILCLEDADYPTTLRQIPDPPPKLFIRGDPRHLQGELLAVVGSRRPTPYGTRNAFWFAYELARGGFVICSGMARGIDGEAHLGALQAEKATVAVLGTGVDVVYPKRHAKLADRIAERGALVSEFPLGTPPLPALFPQRNRLISGLSRATLVIEAGIASGSMITARLALEQNRDVFAVPGAISCELAKGCHQLIRQGACLAESANDILEALVENPVMIQPRLSAIALAENTELDAALGQELLNRLDACFAEEGCVLDTMLAATGLTITQLTPLLVKLEAAGVIAARGGRYFKR